MPANRSGGAAAAGGLDYQHRVAAWLATRILAEQGASAPWGLGNNVTLESLRCEVDQPVDDILVGTSDKGFAFLQVKRALSLSASADSKYGEALAQFVRQFISCRAQTAGKRPWERPLTPDCDRLVLVTTPASSAPVRVHLPAVLDRIRRMPQEEHIDGGAANEKERQALGTTLEHVSRAWRETLGSEPTGKEVRELLSLVWVHILDVESSGQGEREAKDILRASILKNPHEADVAWTLLVSTCSGFALTRSGGERVDLQRVLQNAGIETQAAQSYRADILRLQAHFKQTANLLAPLSRIQVGQAIIKIKRPSTDALRKSAETESMLVVGEPGAGKSGALHDLSETLAHEHLDVVFIAVDSITADSLGALRNDLGLQHELLDILANWPGMNPGFLIIDALDAARAEPAARTIRDLIRGVIAQGNRWHVVASIRKFDLRYGQELKDLFKGSSSTEFQDPEFLDSRHINIPTLSPEELSQIAPQSPQLQTLISQAPSELHGLLRVPFNLRLLAELLGAGVSVEALTPIRTQLDLMDRYWRHRVIRSDTQGDAREAILRSCCDLMIGSRKLRIERLQLPNVAGSAALHDLLSTQVLTEWQPTPTTTPDRYTLAFSHHVLFDYAVSRLVLRADPASLTGRFATEPELLLVIRPSLLLHFRHLWATDRAQFWELTYRFNETDAVPHIGKLIGPAVVADSASDIDALNPLCAALESAEEPRRATAEGILVHSIGALLVDASAGQSLVGAGAGPWSELAERISRSPRLRTVYAIGSLLSTICEKPENLLPAQRDVAGKAARRILKFAWEQPNRDRGMVVRGIECACKTFESDPPATRELLQRSLEKNHLAEHGYEELFWLAKELKRLIPLAPSFIEEVYKAAFEDPDPSDATTAMGSGRIMSMTSNRRQDYHGGIYELANIFPAYLAAHPINATRALVHVMECYIKRKHDNAADDGPPVAFDFRGTTAQIRTDYSSIWDEGDTYDHDDELKMLKAFQTHIEALASQPDGVDRFNEVLETLIRENKQAVFWRRLLIAGTKCPDTLGKQILPLSLAVPILKGTDTTTEAGNYLRMIFSDLPQDQRDRLERTILAIPDTFPEDKREIGERVRDRLIGCLPENAIITEEIERILNALKANNAVPPNVPPISFEGWSSRPYGEEESLKDEGVPVEAEPNRRVRELESPVKQFAQKHLNAVPSLDDSQKLLDSLRQLHEQLKEADARGIHPKQRDYAWGHLTEACERIARVETIDSANELRDFVLRVLLDASVHPEPIHHPEHDAQFDDHPSWGSPAARIPAADGLIAIARNPTCATTEVLEAIRRLSRDPVPAVRFQIARHLNTLYKTAPDLMCECVNWYSESEASRGVLQGFLSHPMAVIANARPEQAVILIEKIYNRTKDGRGAEKVREQCISLLTQLFVWRDTPGTRDRAFTIAGNPAECSHDCHRILVSLRKRLTHGPVEPADEKQDAIRSRGLELFAHTLNSACNALRALEAEHPQERFDSWPEADQKQARAVGQVIDAAGTEVYFASGAFDRKEGRKKPEKEELSDQQRERFYREAAPILDMLSEAGLPSVTHYLLETLEAAVPFDPQGVFIRIGHVIDAGQKGGYQFESLAANLLVRLVERYLAEYRPLLRENEQCRQVLIRALDIFVGAGWPSARRLTYRLEEIFR